MLRFHRFRAWLDVYHHKFVLEATCPELMKYAKRCTGLKAAFYMAKCHANRNDMHNLWVIMRSNRHACTVLCHMFSKKRRQLPYCHMQDDTIRSLRRCIY